MAKLGYVFFCYGRIRAAVAYWPPTVESLDDRVSEMPPKKVPKWDKIRLLDIVVSWCTRIELVAYTNAFQLYFGCIYKCTSVVFRLYFGCISVVFRLYFGCILGVSRLHIQMHSKCIFACAHRAPRGRSRLLPLRFASKANVPPIIPNRLR